uniref:Uncharacterized protein n=1 Tax=Triticum urartu TaxID=4572 RepID=A0A8R7P3R1_TRIUA
MCLVFDLLHGISSIRNWSAHDMAQFGRCLCFVVGFCRLLALVELFFLHSRLLKFRDVTEIPGCI